MSELELDPSPAQNTKLKTVADVDTWCQAVVDNDKFDSGKIEELLNSNGLKMFTRSAAAKQVKMLLYKSVGTSTK